MMSPAQRLPADSANSDQDRQAARRAESALELSESRSGRTAGQRRDHGSRDIQSQSIGRSQQDGAIETLFRSREANSAGGLPGKVLFGGADYQSLSSPPAIDARYLWQAGNGDIIIVRNTGSGTLVPTFEVRTDSRYAWLNTGRIFEFASGNKAWRRGHHHLRKRSGTERGAPLNSEAIACNSTIPEDSLASQH